MPLLLNPSLPGLIVPPFSPFHADGTLNLANDTTLRVIVHVGADRLDDTRDLAVHAQARGAAAKRTALQHVLSSSPGEPPFFLRRIANVSPITFYLSSDKTGILYASNNGQRKLQ